ncbi:hypothetical protein LTR53_018679, partial [Teratosphaeriaceae sp. CCFEE 6253]
MRAESRDVSDIAPPQPPFAQRPQSREGSRYRQSPGPPPSIHDAPRPNSAVANRQLSDSPAPSSRWPPPPATQQVPRPFASQEQMRPASPARAPRHDFHRPGTSPGPRPEQGRTPPPQQQAAQMPPPSFPSTRSESPATSSVASSGLGPARPQVRAASPPPRGAQGQGYQRSASNTYAPEDQAPRSD